ncbi:hypothetical protein GGR52DRAFT_247668 [Hypoxylon sp. FL1284]|nr:hypothetical protein GGR52DRAFT_247668 [Hypoxylon sp. FL1284]
MEDSRAKAKAFWTDVQTIRSDIDDKIASLGEQRGNARTTSRFAEAEEALSELRLASVNAIFGDFEYATGKNIEGIMWQTHVFLNGEFRKTTNRLKSQGQVVVGRQLEKQYRAFLSTAEGFYTVFIQKWSERLYIPELHQIALCTDFPLLHNSNPESTVSAELNAMVLRSCRMTLAHLGDLARYKFQMSSRHSGRTPNKGPSKPNGNFNRALEHYGLANALDPHDGFAHHQMAVLHELQGDHLNILYHFHRSHCVEKPHPLGVKNIGLEFKRLGNGSSRKGQTPSDTMITWFLRLHAFYFEGEQFSQQSELETEALHHTELAVKSDADMVILRKMILINIAAYDVALKKVRESWTMQRSQSAQFLLRFNVRTVLSLLTMLKAGLVDESATSPAPEDGEQMAADAESPICFSQRLMTLLPLVRLYVSWLYVSRDDVAEYREFLEPHVTDVFRLLASTLTLLNAMIDEASGTTSSKYLLPEDAEALGLKPISDESLPLFVKAEELFLSKTNKTHKPRQRVFGRQYQPHTEAVWRIRDTLYCGILLAITPALPIGLTVAEHDGREFECWTFTDDVPSIDEARIPGVLHKLEYKLKLGGMELKTEESAQQPTEPELLNDDAAGPSQRTSLDDDTDHPKPRRRLDKGKSVVRPAISPVLDPDSLRDSEMIEMVNKLVGPIQDDEPQSSQAHADTSYGMSTTMANEILESFRKDSGRPSSKSKVPNITPWCRFHESTSRPSSSQHGNFPLAPNGDYMAGISDDQIESHDSWLYANALVAGPGSPQGVFAHHNHPSRDSSTSLEMSRNAVLDSISSSLYAEHGLTPNAQHNLSSFINPMNTNPLRSLRGTPSTPAHPAFPAANSPQSGSTGKFPTPNYMDRMISRPTSASLAQSRYETVGSNGQPRQDDGSPSCLSDIVRDSSPDDDDDGFGMGYEAGGSPGESRARRLCKNVAPGPPIPQGQSPWAPGSAKNEYLTFSHPSSLFGGTLAPPRSPPHMILANGNYYNASTPFGRLGADYNSQEDPTSFRNQLNSYVGPSTFDSYDKQVLASALLEDNGSQARNNVPAWNGELAKE